VINISEEKRYLAVKRAKAVIKYGLRDKQKQEKVSS